jgi:26S proteasome regulatory subunit N1
MAGVLTILHACIDLKGTLLDKFHYMLYFLAPAMNPRFLVTLDENLEILPTTVRVGLAVETVGQAGRPRTITGFQVLYCLWLVWLILSLTCFLFMQTNTTPVLMGYKDRAELASKEHKPVASVLEGFALVSKSEEEKQEW